MSLQIIPRQFSLRRGARAHKTSVVLLHFITVPLPSQESERSCIYVLGVSIFLLSTIFLLDFETVPTVWYIVMSCLRYLCLFEYSGVPHLLRCVFALFVFVFCALCYRLLWIVHFWFSIRCSLMFIDFSFCYCKTLLMFQKQNDALWYFGLKYYNYFTHRMTIIEIKMTLFPSHLLLFTFILK